MKWSEDATSYLEYLQKREYKMRGLPLPDADTELEINIETMKRFARENFESDMISSQSQKEETLRETLKSIEDVRKVKVPTRYESPTMYKLMMNMFNDIDRCANDLDFELDSKEFPTAPKNFTRHKPVIGTLPTGNMNAMAIAVPSSRDYLVVFENDIFTFSNLVAKIVALAMPFDGIEKDDPKTEINEEGFRFSNREKDVKNNIMANKEIVERFQQLMLGYLLYGSPAAAPQYLLNEPSLSLASIVRDSMELFIMGHEYSHIRIGHLAEEDRDKKIVAHALASGDVDELWYSWEYELEADLFGSIFSMGVMKKRGFDFSLGYWGADLFFSCIDIIDRGTSILRSGKEQNENQEEVKGSHPPPTMRRNDLRSFVKRTYGRDALRSGELGEKIIDILWRNTKPTLIDLYKKGERLHPHFL